MKPPSQFRAVPVDFPPKTAPLIVNDTDEPDETSFRALRPKMLRLTLGTLLRRLAVTRRVRERYLAICSTTVSSEARPRFVRFGGRFEDRRFAEEGV